MRIFFICLTLVNFSTLLFSQKLYNAQWVMGFNLNATPQKDGMLLDFRFDPPTAIIIEKDLDIGETIGSICNKKGELVFYTNGCSVANTTHKMIANGDSLNNTDVYKKYCGFGYVVDNSTVFIPHHNDSTLYSLFHISANYTPNPNGGYNFQPLYRTIIKKNDNNIKDTIIEKNIPLIQDSISGGQLTAVKHANGKDWWIVVPKGLSNAYYSLLFTEKGIVKKNFQKIDNERIRGETRAQAEFSPDGYHYARIGRWNQLMVFDFDRCTGVYSNYRRIKVNDTLINQGNGLAFSPNSRYLYVTTIDTTSHLYQFDMQATDLAKSKVLIDTYDGFKSISSTKFFTCQLASNGKIYILCPYTNDYLHTIHAPDSAGVKCHFKQHDFHLPTLYYIGMPTFPHYTLGASEVVCPTVAEENLPVPFEVRLFPNPVAQVLTIEVPSGNSPTVLTLYNSLGQVVYTTTVPPEGVAKIDMRHYPSGLYFCALQQGMLRVVKKVVME